MPFVTKAHLSVARLETSRAYGIDQLCGDLEASMESTMNCAKPLWDMNFFKDED